MFTIAPRESFINGIFGVNLSPAPKAVPSGSGVIDVVNNFRWKNSGSTDEVPSLYLVEYELAFGSWAQNIARLFAEGAKLFENESIDPYAVMYYADKTGFTYNLPLLLGNSGQIRNITNTWNAYDGITGLIPKSNNPSGTAATIGQIVGSVIGGINSGVGTEDVYKYGQTACETITVSFPLYNTVSLKEAYQNYQFVSLFSIQNVKTRTSYLTFVPPCIYTVSTLNCNGGISWPVAIVENLTIESIGTTRALNEFSSNRILIPEAYKVNIKLKQLIPTSANTLMGTIGQGAVSVIDSGSKLIDDFKGGFMSAIEKAQQNTESRNADTPTS